MSAVDVHAHLIPRMSAESVSAVGSEWRCDRISEDGHIVGPPELYDAQKLSDEVRRLGLERAVVTIPPPLYKQHLEAAGCAQWVAALNDALLSCVEGFDNLVAGAYLPFEHPEVAVAEFERIRSPDWSMVTACVGGRSVPMDDLRLEPIWSTVESASAGVFLHPGASGDGRLRRFYLQNLFGNPVETALAAAQILFGGVLHRHPALRVCLAHGGGATASMLGRWQRGIDTARPGLAGVPTDLRSQARRLYVDNIVHDPALLPLLAATFGSRHVLLGSDWPFPMGNADPVAASDLLSEAVDGPACGDAAAFLGG